jgi:hypothetical protein
MKIVSFNMTFIPTISKTTNIDIFSQSPTSTRTLTPTATSQAHIVSQTSNSGTTASASSCPSTSNNSSPSLSTSSIAVLGFASAVILVAIVLLVICSLRRRRRKRALQQAVPFPVYHNTDGPMSQQASNTWAAQLKISTANLSRARPSELEGAVGISEIDGRTR